MKSPASNRTLLLGVGPLAAVAPLVVALAWWLAGSQGLGVAVVGVLATAALYLASELFVAATGVNGPLERLMLGMLIRGGGGLAAVTAGVVAGGVEPKLVALVALPLYAALVAGEIFAALSLQSAATLSVGDGD